MKDLANAYAEWLKRRERRALLEHAALYLLINAFLITLNLLTSPRELWFQYPLLLWGFGLLMHFLSVFFLTDYGAVGEKFAVFVNGKPLHDGFVRFHREKARRGVITHAILYAVANAVLVVLSLSLSLVPNGTWLVYPLLGWGVVLLLHLIYGYMLYDWEGLYATFVIKAKAKGG